MTHEAIGPRHDEFVIGAEAGINAPLASEGAGARPGKENPEREEDDGENDLPGARLAQPELALPQERVADGDDHYAPASTPVDLLGGIAAAFDEGEGRHPKKPCGDEDGVGIGGHGRDCSSTGFGERSGVTAGDAGQGVARGSKEGRGGIVEVSWVARKIAGKRGAKQ